jgi:hypothetical protein
MKLLRAALASVFLMSLPLLAFASFLPAELGDWRLSSEQTTELAASENLGRWTSASYVRPAPPARIEFQLTEGPGPGRLFVPEGIMSSDDGPIGFLSTYETLNIAGRRGVLERGEVTGQALAVALGTRTATFESRSISKHELLSFAESMIEHIAGYVGDEQLGN